MASHRGAQQVINRVRDNTPYNPNNRVNKKSTSGMNGTAANVLNNMVINVDYASTNAERTNRENVNRATTNTNNNSTANNKNFLNVDNNIANNTITRDECNTVVNAYINSEGRIVGMVEENLQSVIVQGPQAQGCPPSTNDVDLNNNGGVRNNNTQHIRPHRNN